MIDAPVRRIDAAAYRIPTEEVESDGTLVWDQTTIVVAYAEAGGKRGIGYSYTDAAAALLIRDLLADVVKDHDAMAPTASWRAMVDAVRNLGRRGIAATAIAAVDVALWDLKARLLDLSLLTLLGAVRERVPVYGSGGFTSHSVEQLTTQCAAWSKAGIGQIKIKVGRDPARDRERVRAARDAIGPRTCLFVDANGAYSRKLALAQAEAFADAGVSWFEEPVSSDDLPGLRLVRDRAPAGMEIAAGEYGYDAFYFRRMLETGSVDVLQADATRCAGVTGFLQAGALCDAYAVPLSAHTAPSLHGHLCCAVERARHVEFFFDHARIEPLLFEGSARLADGCIVPDTTRPGLGLEFRTADAAPSEI